MTIYCATRPHGPQLDVSGDDLMDVLQRTERAYEDGEYDWFADDGSRDGPELTWQLRRPTATETVMDLYADGQSAGVRVEVAS